MWHYWLSSVLTTAFKMQNAATYLVARLPECSTVEEMHVSSISDATY